MMRWMIIFLSLVMSSLALAGSDVEDFEYGKRPSNAVFDPDSLLNSRVENRLSAELAKIRAEDNVDILVVVLNDLGQAPPEHVARRFAIAWCEGPAYAVILHVPGRPDGPWIVPGGVLVDAVTTEIVREGVASTVRRVAQESKDSDKVRTAVMETSDMLRFWLGGAVIRGEQATEQRAQIREDFQKYSLNSMSWRVRFLLLAAAVLTLLAVIMFFVFLIINKRKHRIFGAPLMPRRLGAPYCGGNHAVVSSGQPFERKPHT